MLVHDVDESGWLWFVTDRHSRKACELSQNPHATIAFQSKKGDRYVSVQGTAVVVRDDVKLKELWNPTLRSWFPRGRRDPEIVLVAVRVARAEYWLVPRTRLVRVIGMVKAHGDGKAARGGQARRFGSAPAARMKSVKRTVTAETLRRRRSYAASECPPASIFSRLRA